VDIIFLRVQPDGTFQYDMTGAAWQGEMGMEVDKVDSCQGFEIPTRSDIYRPFGSTHRDLRGKNYFVFP
jgi:hypothetical protein